VGITGSGGAGKSTLVGCLVAHLRSLGLRVAVLASDPQSPVTGGALLGDRIRVRIEPDDEGIYFRSLSTRGAAGGISAAVEPAIAWLKAFGFDAILIETVGVGQDQVAVRSVVDVLVLLVTPHTGDEVQWEKAGLIEVADLIAINKSDLPGADRVRQQLTSALSLVPGAPEVPVVNITAATGQGVAELWQKIVEIDDARV
jgi:LAO/AO transport system kinase